MGPWLSKATPPRIMALVSAGTLLVVPPVYFNYPLSLDIISFIIGGVVLITAYLTFIAYIFNVVVGRIHQYDEERDDGINPEDIPEDIDLDEEMP